ncbi:MAG: hypothetical protein HQK55_07965 [Deltaproteobacteria bacterium]|nr:hypothetical protein [Deltaproteobacteria bacterium]
MTYNDEEYPTISFVNFDAMKREFEKAGFFCRREGEIFYISISPQGSPIISQGIVNIDEWRYYRKPFEDPTDLLVTVTVELVLLLGEDHKITKGITDPAPYFT